MPKGTVLLPKSGASTFLNHRVITTVDAYVSSHLATITAKPNFLDSRFLLYAVSRVRAQDLLPENSYPSLNLSLISSTTIPLPPLDEQKRIVAVLDEAFEGLSRLRTNAQSNLSDAHELLNNETDQLLLTGGPDWKHCVLENVISRFEYGTSTKSEGSGSVPVLRMGNLQHGEVDWSDLVYTNEISEIDRLLLRDRDVLFNRTNSLEHVGKAAIVRGDRKAIFAGYLVRLHCKPELLDPEFLTCFLNCRPTREYGRSVAGKSVNQANISAGKLKTYPISLPPLQEQKEIATRILDLRRAIGEVGEGENGKLRGFDSLRQSLLQKALSGELT